jgi:hypothetical protein
MDAEIKVYKMNEYESWASKLSAEETNEWYNKNIDENDIEDVKLCDIDKEGMWYLTEDPKDVERLGDSDEIIGFEVVNGMRKRKVQFGDLMRRCREVYKYISFREAIQKEPNYTEPYCIATTEW